MFINPLRFRLSLLLLWLFVGCPSALAIDFNFESMLSPGKLSNAHIKQEKDCKQCHDDAHKNENALCISCHKPVGADIAEHKGFHGKSPGVAGSECRLCHSEHHGREADIVQLGQSSFAHQFTDFKLEGKHQELVCEQCHKAGKAYRDAPQQCFDCHQSDDIHKGSQGEDCADCHAASTWQKTLFDHDKTAFPLNDLHKEVGCTQCHRSTDYKQADTECASCHKIDDVHLGRFGQECKSCHNSKGWKKTAFNHALDTDFDLRGAHATLTCNTCHTASVAPKDTPNTCNGCHQQDDVHDGRNGTDCLQCHTETQWGKSRFNHDKTRFPLQGAHNKATCEQCHASDVHAPIKDTTCIGCHATDDAHKKSLGTQCDQCHSIKTWHDDIRFDHELTAFPLLGMHATVGCEACHADTTFKGAPQACKTCHADDPHKGSFGQKCQQCHHPIGWSSWQFDHDKQTQFELTGQHKGLECAACHHEPAGNDATLSQVCGSCHQADDEHRGAYGAQCDTCHDTQDFSAINMR